MLADARLTGVAAKVSNRLAVAIVVCVVAAVSATAVGWIALHTTRVEHEDRAAALLRSELAGHKNRVQNYLQGVASDVRSTAASQISRRTLGEFQAAFAELGAAAAGELQRVYITDNPNPPGRKQALLQADDGSRYSQVHALYHDWFSQMALDRDYYDLLLVGATGTIIYSVHKELDFATNLVTGAFRNTGLAATFNRLRGNPDPGATVFNDFAVYAPSGNVPAAFLGAAYVVDGVFLGALIAQLKSTRLDDLMRYSRIMGDTGETYLVGNDYLMRSRSRFQDASSVLKTRVATASVDAALNNTSGVLRTTDYRGVPVMSAYAPLSWSGVTWAILAEIDLAEIAQPMVALRSRLVLGGGICALLAFLLGWLLADRRAES